MKGTQLKKYMIALVVLLAGVMLVALFGKLLTPAAPGYVQVHLEPTSSAVIVSAKSTSTPDVKTGKIEAGQAILKKNK